MSKSTARNRLVASLIEDILKSEEEDFLALPSEYQLCERFGVSRVTVRLALTDLERLGLVYRRHGKGTFALGKARRLQKPTAVLVKDPDYLQMAAVSETLRGFQKALAEKRSHLTIIDRVQDAVGFFRPNPFVGVLVIPFGVGLEEYRVLRSSSIPYVTAWETENPPAEFQQFVGLEEGSRQSVRRLFEKGHRKVAMLTYNGVSEIEIRKRAGVMRACGEFGIEFSSLLEWSVGPGARNGYEAATILVQHGDLTAVIVSDDRLGEMVVTAADKHRGGVPKELSVVSLQAHGVGTGFKPTLCSVDYHFQASGQAAAITLVNQQTGNAKAVAEERGFTLIAGDTIGAAEKSA